MPYPIANVIADAGFSWTDMKSIENTQNNGEKIKESFRKKWKDKMITDEDICNDLFDYNGVPVWIKNEIEQERSTIQNEIKTAN